MKRKFLAITMLLTICLSYFNCAEAKTVKINVGELKQLKSTYRGEKITWKVKEGEQYVSISKRGNLKGTKKGIAKIVALDGKKVKKTMKIKVNNDYFKADFSEAVSMRVTNLTFGTETYFDAAKITELERELSKYKLYRVNEKVVKGKNGLKLGDSRYRVCLIDKNGAEYMNIVFRTDEISVQANSDSEFVDYKSDADIQLPFAQ